MFIDILAHPDLKKYDLSSLRKGNGICTKLGSQRIKAEAEEYIWVTDQTVRSRWLDIGQVLFMRVYGPRRRQGP